ncbi:MAG: hypothetical protein R2699_16475 [Acidimicrobiales bacterium]
MLLTVLLAALTLNGTVAAAKVRPQLDELKPSPIGSCPIRR